MDTKFVTLSNQRSGSSWFQRMLQSHPEIWARQEDLASYQDRGIGVESFLDTLYASHPEVKAFGFKIQYSHITKEVVDYIKSRELKVIQLIRNDLLATTVWFDRVVQDNKVDVAFVKDYIKKLRANINKYRKLADYTVYYEQAMKLGFGGVLEFLEVKDVELSCDMVRNERPDVKTLSNYEELMKGLGRMQLTYNPNMKA